MNEANKLYCIGVACKLKEHNVLTDDKIQKLTKDIVYRPRKKHYKAIKCYHTLIKSNKLNDELYEYMLNMEH